MNRSELKTCATSVSGMSYPDGVLYDKMVGVFVVSLGFHPGGTRKSFHRDHCSCYVLWVWDFTICYFWGLLKMTVISF